MLCCFTSSTESKSETPAVLVHRDDLFGVQETIIEGDEGEQKIDVPNVLPLTSPLARKLHLGIRRDGWSKQQCCNEVVNHWDNQAVRAAMSDTVMMFYQNSKDLPVRELGVEEGENWAADVLSKVLYWANPVRPTASRASIVEHSFSLYRMLREHETKAACLWEKLRGEGDYCDRLRGALVGQPKSTWENLAKTRLQYEEFGEGERVPEPIRKIKEQFQANKSREEVLRASLMDILQLQHSKADIQLFVGDGSSSGSTEIPRAILKVLFGQARGMLEGLAPDGLDNSDFEFRERLIRHAIQLAREDFQAATADPQRSCLRPRVDEKVAATARKMALECPQLSLWELTKSPKFHQAFDSKVTACYLDRDGEALESPPLLDLLERKQDSGKESTGAHLSQKCHSMSPLEGPQSGQSSSLGPQ